ncbi:YceI family protein [Wenzhouxiangella sp. 15190]|nr:YceI family protein [Wenzhouxiangella sp. 15190]RFF26610.1 YceI family protein [Wenzhouxiangella sp. 15181]RFP67640.1 YceI family protein [Wenzhouxiangella sp. 15190]
MAKGMMLALLMLPGLSLADCFRADQEDGELKFIGAAEGNRFTGEFGEFKVSLCMDARDLESAGIDVVVKTASADTGDGQRDSELHGENFFHVEEYPEATWESTDIRADGEAFVAEGDLTLRGITGDQTVRLRLSDDKPPVLSGSAEIMRLDWNVGTGDEDFEDTDFIRNRVDLEFELQLQPYSGG